MSKPLLVLDTNVVFDLLHFDDATARPLRLALEAGRLRCVVTEATRDEWRRVLDYPEFGLDPAQRAALVRRYQSLSELVPAVAAGASPPVRGTPIHDGLLYPARQKPMGGRMPLPRCSDPDDQMFIELAAAVPAQGLVSKDRALLRLRRRCAALFRIMTPAEAVHWLDAAA